MRRITIDANDVKNQTLASAFDVIDKKMAKIMDGTVIRPYLTFTPIAWAIMTQLILVGRGYRGYEEGYKDGYTDAEEDLGAENE